jgi:hypothetical protein
MQILRMNTQKFKQYVMQSWTQDVKDAYATFKASQEAELGG